MAQIVSLNAVIRELLLMAVLLSERERTKLKSPARSHAWTSESRSKFKELCQESAGVSVI